ncbi:Eco57I restriction-modification methylase domain-containing protein [Sphingomonas sp. HMP6]|uniref:Eco57I restriction-modification methylase domain-containing protein n=1 Tax=Sphingomonas sp. HMP6 TaxID=1517551 RepID=UPI0015969CED|nr:restriction endonuclease [Sphingomonas sp. HMP6]BCA59297.1 restriction endonuclease [Sphingomonas sp. HMP6]
MNDPSLFTSGALFTQDYLSKGITDTGQYRAVDPAATRSALAKILSGFPHASKPNEATTEGDLIWPILGLLGWTEYLTQQNLSATGRLDVPDGLLFIDAAAKANANGHPQEWLRYQFGAAIIESKRWGRALDRAEGKTEKDTPSTQLLRYLRRIDDLTNGDLRWGILTNGSKWRLYFSGARSTIDDYLELDLARIMRLDGDLLDTGVTDGERDHWLAVFVAMFSRTAFERASAKAPSFHDTARREAAFYEERVAKSLSDLVFTRLYPALGKAVARAAPAATDLDDVRQATLILLYRLLFVLYAEDRGLLPVRDKRFDDYALRDRRLEIGRRKDEGDVFSSVAKNIWNHFANLAEMIDLGDASVGLPPYNGGLFNAEKTPLLKAIALGDDVMAEAIDILSFEQHGGRRRYINYRDLSVQQLGSIYERLLEFELIRDEAGAVDIRPNIFARKNSGSYYTPDDLVLLILDETLEPLITDALTAFKAELGRLKAADSEDYRIAQLQKVDPAKAITRLRICDPAMGSGHFLVSLVDRLTNHTLDAIDEARTLARDTAGLDYESPVAEEIRKVRATIRHNAEDARWTVSEEQLDDPQLVKRMVLKRCVYGADKNPMAVELAKVSLWLHTFTVGAPLSFIDHHLAAGDSLFGLWVRDAIDKAGKGGELLYVEELRNAERQAAVMQRIEALTDAEIAEAKTSADMWHEVEAQTGPLDGFVSFMHALDWLDLKGADKALISLWLDGQFGEPIPIARGRKAPEAYRAKPAEAERFHAIWTAARALIGEERFLNWQITFPGVWSNWASKGREGGFDAVVGNPPWDRIKLQQVEWFAARRPEIARSQKASDRTKMILRLKTDGDPLFVDFAKADRRAADTLRVARKSGHYPLLSRGDINLYSLFVERAHSLVRPGGMIGLLTPSGIASDLSASEFFRKVATGGHLKALFDFENRRTRYALEAFFPDVDSRFKFAAMIASPDRTFQAAQCGFFLQSVEERKNPDQAFPIAAADFARVNPNTGTAPIFRTRRDMTLTTAIYDRLPVLVDKSGPSRVQAWPVMYATMFHMTNDSHLFRTKLELEEQEGAWPIGGNRWQSKDGEWVPLYVGRMIHQFDHRAASVTVNEENLHNAALSGDVTADMKADHTFSPLPQFWIVATNDTAKGPTIAYRDIARATDARTFIASFVPNRAAGNTAPLVLSDAPVEDQALLLANFNALVLDYVTRQKAQSTHLNWYLVEQLPVIPPADYARPFGPKSAADIVKAAVLELTYTAHDMAHFARYMSYVDAAGDVLPPFVWDEDRRLHLRAKLDALYFILYGVYDPANPAASRDDIRYIYSTFPIVERQEMAAYGRYRSRDLALAYINTLMGGQPDAVVAG